MAPPINPTDLVITATEVGKLHLTWTAPSPAIEVPAEYWIHSGLDSDAMTGPVIKIGTETVEYTTAALGAGITMYYDVFTATNVGGVAEVSTVGTGTETGTTWDVPDAPTLTSVTAGLKKLILTWEAPILVHGSAVTNYKIYAGDASAPGSLVLLTTVGNVLTYTESPLTDGKLRFYQVTAINAVGESIYSTEESATTWNVPNVPKNLAVTVAAVEELHLAWETPDVAITVPAKFRVYAGDSAGVLTFKVDIGTDTFVYDETGLTGGQTRYYKVVTATNVVAPGSGDESEPTSTENGTTWPSTPTNLAVSATGIGQLTLTWTVSSTATGYRIYKSTTDTDANYALYIGSDVLTTGSDSYVDGTYANGATKWYKISATNDTIGESVLSGAVSGLTWDHPTAPQNLAVGRGIRHLDLSWDIPVSDGGTSITSYNIYTEVAGVLNVQGTTAAGVRTYIDIYDGITDGETRLYKVSAVNDVGEGTLTGTESGETYNIPSQPTGFTVGSGANELTLTWGLPVSDGGLAISQYNIYGGDSPGVLVVLGTVASGLLTYTETGLTDDKLRYYVVSGSNAVGEGVKTAELNGTTYHAPGAPTNLAVGRGIKELTLSWVAPVDIGGLTIGIYTIYAGTASTYEVEIGTVAGGVLTYTESSLDNAERRYYQVSATNSEGTSAKSGEVSGITYDVPSVPIDLTVTGGHHLLDIMWGTSVSDGGTAITAYKVYFGTVLVTTTGSEPITVTQVGLGDGVSRAYTVVAVNGAGDSLPTAPVTGTTWVVPGAPTGLSLEPGDGQVYIISWTAPASTGGSAITNYKIYRGTSALVVNTLVATVSATIAPYLDSSLTNGVTYYYKISAVTIVGEGAKSAEAHGLVTAAPVTLTNQYLYNAESLREFVYDLSGSSSYVLPIPTNFLVLAIIPSFTSETNIVASARIVADKTAKTVKVIDVAGSPSPLEFNLNVIVFCRDKLFQTDN